jgi:type VI secretion system secreted protein VgrG
VGIWFRFTTDTRLNIDVVEFYDSRQGYEKGLILPSVPPSGQHSQGMDSVWGMESYHNVVQKQVSTRDYNYRQANNDMNTQVDATRGDSTTYGEAYHYADNYLTPGSTYDRNPAPESGAFYARIRHERYLNGQTQLSAITSCPTLAPGLVLKVTGGYEVTEAFSQGVLITGMKSAARRDKDFEVHFSGIPDSTDFGFRPEPGARPVMAGTLPARVTSTTENDTYGHIDKDGRYRVNMLFDRDNWETGFESLWVRQSRPYAGDTYGLHLPLLAGTEVAIGFEDGNPDRPYIAGVLHDSAHDDHVTIRNYKRNVLRTPSNNKIRLDDSRGQEHIKISTEYGGKSQLNLGHLVDSEKQKRGEGFELRTDSWGAIRAQKGIFISADGQAKAQGQVLEMQPAVSLLKGAVNQITEWGSITQTHHNFSPDTDPLGVLVNGASELKEAALLMSAPKGIAAVTPETTLLHSGKGLYLQSLGEVNVATAQRYSVNASKAISLLAKDEGMRLVSAKGPLTVESHADTLSLTSLKDITVQSTQGHLQLTAKNGITIGCGGAYIRLTPQGEVEIHGPGLISLKGQHNLQGPASEDFPLPELPASVCKECLKKAQAQAQGFVPREA